MHKSKDSYTVTHYFQLFVSPMTRESKNWKYRVKANFMVYVRHFRVHLCSLNKKQMRRWNTRMSNLACALICCREYMPTYICTFCYRETRVPWPRWSEFVKLCFQNLSCIIKIRVWSLELHECLVKPFCLMILFLNYMP